MRWSGASRSCRASNTWTSTPRTSRSGCATTAPPEGPDRGMRGPPPATTAYPGGVNQFSPDAPARAHDFSLSSADDGLAALSAWRGYPRVQQPVWPDEAERSAVFDDLRAAPPLVFAGEVDVLRERVAAAARGEAFLLVGGDCAETFAEATADRIRNKIRTILQMAAGLTYGDRKSTRLNSSHVSISYAVFCLKKK